MSFQSLLSDDRNIKNGNLIPDENYSDQPYILKTDDGAWLCVITTGHGKEGVSGQHIVTQRSLDQGKTWVDWVDVEPSEGPEASYAVLLKAPSGRVFVFYNHNTDNVRSVLGDEPPYKNREVKRVDSQGYFVFKYSDDHGKTWSKKRYTIPVREFEIDRNNPYNGKIRYFWNVGKAFESDGIAYVPLIKVGGFGKGFFTSSEGILLQSPNLFKVKDPSKAKWVSLPDGDVGLRTPKGGGPIAEEQSYVVLSDGSIFSVYRTIDGYPTFTYSRDGGHTWDEPQYLKYADGRLIKHPRAANFVWKCENGKYLYWFHNHGGKFIEMHPNRPVIAYSDRNPVWVAGGVEADSPNGKIILWSQPEILLYDDDPIIRMSYPDLIEDRGNYYISETQKDLARVHQVDKNMLNNLWKQFEVRNKTKDKLVLAWQKKSEVLPVQLKSPQFPIFYKTDYSAVDHKGVRLPNGFTVELAFNLHDLSGGQILIDNRTTDGVGWCIRTNDKQGLDFFMNDGQTQASWSCDEGLLRANQIHYVSFIVDGGPAIISVVVDGILNDGSDKRQFGWGRFSPFLKTAQGGNDIVIGSKVDGSIISVNIYTKALKTTEVIGNYRWFISED
jgi:hypothetical protein